MAAVFQPDSYQNDSFQQEVGVVLIACLDDLSSHSSAVVITASTRTFCNGKLVTCMGNHVATHPRQNQVHPQPANIILNGAAKTFIDGNKLARIGEVVACGAIIKTPSTSRKTYIPG